jgi:hypothetical protein
MSDVLLDKLTVQVDADIKPLRKEMQRAEKITEKSQKRMETILTRSNRLGTWRLGQQVANFQQQNYGLMDTVQGMAQSTERGITRSILKQAVMSPLSGELSGLSGSVSSGFMRSSMDKIMGGIFGRATGGTVARNSPYMVGERGPELFVPQTAGRVEPHGARAGEQGGARQQPHVTINMTVQTPNPDAFRYSQSQIMTSAAMAADRTLRNR